MTIHNLLSPAAGEKNREVFDTILENSHFRLERIVSSGQATPKGEWLEQEKDEWVVLLAGSAGLLFEGESTVRRLNPGDCLVIPARRRHRVDWTDPAAATVWLALHYG